MKSLPNEIVLRPRFQLELDQDKETILNLFEKSQKTPLKEIFGRPNYTSRLMKLNNVKVEFMDFLDPILPYGPSLCSFILE